MSAQQFFSEVEAVVGILSEYVNSCSESKDDEFVYDKGGQEIETEVFAATWQAIELLARAHTVLLAMAQFEMSKQALNVPDVQRTKVPRLYDGKGEPLA